MRKTRSKIEELGIEELVNDLFEANATYEHIAKAVQGQTGKTISDSALSRYRTHWAARKASEEAMGQELDRLTELLKADPEVDLKQGAMAMFWKKLIQRMAAVDATFDGASLLELAHLLLKAKRVDQSKEHLDLQRERLELLKQKVAAVADQIEAIGRAKNLDQETLDEIREKVYGLTPAAA